MSAQREIRIGLVGYGFIGKIHALAYQTLPMMYDPFPADIRLVGVSAASQGWKQHQMTFNHRFIPALMRAKQLVEEGFPGSVFSFRAAYLHAGYIDPNRPIS